MNFERISRRAFPLAVSLSLGLMACGVEMPGELEGAEATEIAQEARKGGGNDTVAPCTLAVASISPSSYAGYSQVIVSGAGFVPGNAVNWVHNGVATYDRADSNGASRSLWTLQNGASATVTAKEFSGREYVACGSITFTVQ